MFSSVPRSPATSICESETKFQIPTLHYLTLHYIALHCSALHCIALHCIAFPGSRVSQNDCRMWNMPYKYKNIGTVQLKFSHTKKQENTVVTHMRLFKNTSTYIHQYCRLTLFTQPLDG
jgi:hypothetical protein